MRHHCPVCGNKVEMQIVGGRILLFNKEGNYHSCAVDKKKKGVNMKRKALPVLLIFVLLVSFGCATLKASWDKATEDEKARLVLFGLQKSVKASLQTGIAYVTLHPEKKAEWKTKVIPMFDAVNKILLDLELQGASGKSLSVVGVSLAVVGRIAEIEAILTGWGVKLTYTSEKVMEFAGIMEGGLS